jgi:hypothetical protein
VVIGGAIEIVDAVVQIISKILKIIYNNIKKKCLNKSYQVHDKTCKKQ